MTDIKARNTAVDFIKAIAILGVIMIHVSSGSLTQNTVGTFEWTSGLFWGALFRASVPLFLMASGAIMLEPSKTFSLKKLYLHNIARIVVAMLVWGFAYKIYHLLEDSQLSLDMLWYSAKRLLLFDQEFHFYYIHMILIVYVFLPVTRFFVEKADKKLIQYTLIVWVMLAIIFPTLRNFSPFNLFSGMTGQWIINMTYSSIGYGVLGYYMKKYPLTLRTALLCLISGFFIIFGGTFYMSQKLGVLNEIFLQGTSVGVCVFAIGIFAVSKFVKVKGSLQKMAVYISKASFCVYLSHMFILYIFQKFILAELAISSVILIPICSIIILLVCLIIYAIISKIPVLSKWIV